MKIACLGWGSLVWSPGVLRCVGGWREDGPSLPVEFARTSRDGRLTMVLLEGATEVRTLWTELDYATPEQAQEALAGREGCSVHAIGMWPGKPPQHGAGSESIAEWASSRGFDALVWTAVRPKFDGTDGSAPSSPEAAIAYLRGLNAEVTAKAREYFERAPAQVQTPTRVAVEVALGWSSADSSHRGEAAVEEL